jgi:hypothetical protein
MPPADLERPLLVLAIAQLILNLDRWLEQCFP